MAKDYANNYLIETPAFVYDEEMIENTAARLSALCGQAGCKMLYTLKPMGFSGIVELLRPYVDGFSASSLFEAIYASSRAVEGGSLHITTPGFLPDQIDQIANICDYIAFNSLSQWGLFSSKVLSESKCGLRINPDHSLVEDERYDPCRIHSKLGVPIDQLVTATRKKPALLDGLTGLHFHTNCDSPIAKPLLDTVRFLDDCLCDMLESLEWINLGGGYLLPSEGDNDAFLQAIGILRAKYDLDVFVEPGAAFVRDGCSIVASVIDIFDSDGKTIAVLDTTVNHMPEVFEYQYIPDVASACQDGKHNYILAGCSCLAGDLFGEYSFRQPLETGSRIVFTNMGAYTMVKWHCFNGINLPNIYARIISGEIVPRRSFNYGEYADRLEVKKNVIASN